MRGSLALAASLCLALGVTQAQAQDAKPEDMQVVPVNGMKAPDMLEYRHVWVGLETFDDNRKLAPGAELHFRVVPRRSVNKQRALGDITLKIVGDGEPVQVPIAADGLLTMPRLQEAYDSKALLVMNRRKGLYQTMPDIRTPGLPDNVRRLGDLRLECKVLIAIVKEEIGFFAKAAINTLLMTTDWCTFKEMDLQFWMPKEVESATLIHGDRRAEAKVEYGQAKAPLGDKSWPDDTLIEVKYKE